ncbi:MAG: PBECR2 nuclease fold domain-containing protein [Nanoarchaeota archaeon]
MNFIFEITDKTGRKIYLSKERWNHITSPSSPHSYMANYLEKVKETLSNPDKIVESIYEDSKVFYYRYYKDNGKFLRVIVKYLNGRGYVITTYFVMNTG